MILAFLFLFDSVLGLKWESLNYFENIVHNNSIEIGPSIDRYITLPDGTKLKGSQRNGVVAFKGIPFAQAPVGSLRWSPPVEWINPHPESVYDATKYGSMCVQGILPRGGAGNEDCLFLNIWVPSSIFDRNPPKPLPVGVFVHGGSYNTGSGSMYSGHDLVSFWNGAAIMVTVNYRLNVFGFLGSEELRQGDGVAGSTGNYGLQDQRMALQWVKNNIGVVGGNPKLVTLFGESAGGGSVSNHLVMKASRGLFSSAALESGSFSEWITQPMNVAETTYQNFVRATNCTDLSCLKSMSTEEVFDISLSIPTPYPYAYPYLPTADGVEILTHPWISLSQPGSGNIADVPILHGTNRDEGAAFLGGISKDATYDELISYWASVGYTTSQINTLEEIYLDQTYPETEGVSNYFWSAARSAGDVTFSCAAKYTSEQLSHRASLGERESATYMYHFEHTRDKARFVTHFHEVPFVFHWEYAGFNTPADQDMTDVIATYWGNFIISSNPSSNKVGLTNLPIWSAFTEEGKEIILLPLKETISVANEIKQKECDFFIGFLDERIRSAFE